MSQPICVLWGYRGEILSHPDGNSAHFRSRGFFFSFPLWFRICQSLWGEQGCEAGVWRTILNYTRQKICKMYFKSWKLTMCDWKLQRGRILISRLTISSIKDAFSVLICLPIWLLLIQRPHHTRNQSGYLMPCAYGNPHFFSPSSSS